MACKPLCTLNSAAGGAPQRPCQGGSKQQVAPAVAQQQLVQQQPWAVACLPLTGHSVIRSRACFGCSC
jgi:hypothetical protein